MTNTTRSLSTVRPSLRTDRRVCFGPGMAPLSHPHAQSLGSVFSSQGRETWVLWDGETRPVCIFTGALVLA